MIIRTKPVSGPPKVFLRNLSTTSTTSINGVKVEKDALVVLEDSAEIWLGYPGDMNAAAFKFIDLHKRRPFLRDHVYEVILGSGTYGEVHKVHKRGATHQKLAVKVLDYGRSFGRLTAAQARSEIATVHSLLNHNHPYIVRLFNIYADEDQAFMHLYTMEFLPQGDLFEALVARGANFVAIPEIQVIMHQLLTAVEFLHEKGISHRDIKLTNMLVRSSSPWCIALADFGAAKAFDVHERLTSFVGTRAYVAPEVVRSRGGLQGNLGLEPYRFVQPPCSFEQHIRYRSLDWDRLLHRRLEDTAHGRNVLEIARGLLEESPEVRLSLQAALRSSWLLDTHVVSLRDLKGARTQPGSPNVRRVLSARNQAEEDWERALEAAAYTTYDAHPGGEMSFVVPAVAPVRRSPAPTPAPTPAPAPTPVPTPVPTPAPASRLSPPILRRSPRNVRIATVEPDVLAIPPSNCTTAIPPSPVVEVRRSPRLSSKASDANDPDVRTPNRDTVAIGKKPSRSKRKV
ncbi:unnamed protein product [Peniophora sp. CBMAI 1063]|nr:unnamed protein product [Peniophora sp. CBMAI 1063]